MSERYSWARVLSVSVVLIAWALARTAPLYDTVFSRPDRPVLVGVDALFHARHATHTATRFPHLLRADPGSHYPAIESADVVGLYNVALALVSIGLAGGTPDPALVETVAAWSPVVISVLAVAGTMALSAWLGSWWAGLLAGLLLLWYPGSVGARSVLGFADQHVVELTCVLLACLAMAAAAKRRAKGPASAVWTRAPLYGSALALLMYSWLGAPLYIAVLSVAAAASVFVSAAFDRDPRPWCTAVSGVFGGFAVWQVLVRFAWPALQVEYLPGIADWTLAASVAVAALAPAGAWLALRIPPHRRTGVVLVAAVAAVLALGWFFSGNATGRGFWNWATYARGADVQENRAASMLDLWNLHGPVYGLGLVGLVYGFRRADALKASLVQVGITGALLTGIWLSAHDFEYAAPLPVFVLAGIGLDAVLRALAGLRRLPGSGLSGGVQWVGRSLAVLLALGILVLPFIPAAGVRPPWPAAEDVRQGMGGNLAWYDAMTWLREHSPEPSISPFDLAPARDSLGHDPGTYGVMTPWDAGNAVALVARRLPVASRYPSAADASWMAETDEGASIARLCPGCRVHEGTVYAVVDAEQSGPGLLTKMRLVGREPGTGRHMLQLPDRTVTGFRFDSTVTRSMAFRLYFEDGQGMAHYRLVYETPDPWYSALSFDTEENFLEFVVQPLEPNTRTPWTEGRPDPRPTVVGRTMRYDHLVTPAVKVYRVVRGARLEGTAPPGALVAVRLEQRSAASGRSWLYERRTRADSGGAWTVRVPYSTRPDTAWTDVLPVGPYRVAVSAGGVLAEMPLEVSENDVVSGTTKRLPDPFER